MISTLATPSDAPPAGWPSARPVRVGADATHAATARLIRSLRLIGLALALGLLGGTVFSALTAHRAAIVHAERDARQLDALLADGTLRLFEAVDQVLIATLAALQGRPPERLGETGLPTLLRGSIAGQPALLGIVVTDAEGQIVLDSRTQSLAGLRVNHREYFGPLRDIPGFGLHVGLPVRSVPLGVEIIPVSRRIDLADGRFGGVVSAGIRVEHLESLFATAIEHEGSSIGLLRGDGGVLARQPRLPPGAPNPVPGLAEQMADLARGPPVVRAPGPIDRDDRLVARRRLLDDRLALAVTVPVTAVLAPWRHDTAVSAALTLLMMGGIVLTLTLLERQIRRSAAATAARQDSETALRLNHAELAAIYDGTPVGLCVLDRDLCYRTANRHLAGAAGVAPEAIIGRSMIEMRPDIAGQVEPVLRQVLATGEPVDHFEYQAERDGRRRSWLASYRALRDADGAIVAVAASMLEVTALREAEAAQRTLEANLRRSETLTSLGELTGGLAHDFNNLLTILLGNVEMLRDMHEQDPETMDLLQEIHIAAHRGGDLTRSLLAFARRQPLAPQPLDVNGLVESTASLLRRTLGGRVEIKLALGASLPPAIADRAQLEAALTNLATNARDAMPQGGALTFSTELRRLEWPTLPPDVSPGDYVVIGVADEGTGMTPEVRARLFEPFFTTKRGAGTGLGLSMVFGFVKQSGGHIEVESAVGSGTVFRLHLPCEAGPVAVTAPAVPALADMGAGETVLVVDDDDPVRRIVARHVASLGYCVVQAASGAEAIAILERDGPVDLVFCDVMMPGRLDGYDVAAIVAERWPTVRVLLTSGFPGTASAFAAGAAGRRVKLLAKPYRREALAAALSEALAGDGGQGSRRG